MHAGKTPKHTKVNKLLKNAKKKSDGHGKHTLYVCKIAIIKLNI